MRILIDSANEGVMFLGILNIFNDNEEIEEKREKWEKLYPILFEKYDLQWEIKPYTEDTLGGHIVSSSIDIDMNTFNIFSFSEELKHDIVLFREEIDGKTTYKLLIYDDYIE